MIRFGNITIDANNLLISNGARNHQWPTMLKNGRPMTVLFRLTKHLLLSGGMSRYELFDLLHKDDPEGGPLYGPHIIDIYLNQVRSKWDKLGLTLHKNKVASEMRYWLVAE